MPQYLRHPRHGSKVAISDLEVAADLLRGWERYDPTVPEPKADELPTDNTLEVKRRRRTTED